jgi:hypothetical protein
MSDTQTVTDLVCSKCGRIIRSDGTPYNGIVITDDRSNVQCILCIDGSRP